LELNTISDSKEIFYKEFPYVIPHVFRKVADEILVELNLLSHQKDFKPDAIFSIGLVQIFSDLTYGYEPKKHLTLLFNALCNCNRIDPLTIKKESGKALESNKDLNLNKIKDFINNDSSTISLFKGENKIYNRISIVGIYSIIENIKKTNQENNEINSKEITIKIGTRLDYPEDRMERDINLYFSSVEKIKQALELIKLLNKK
tara:strand:+ start:14311 stop:14919 length:609 start_codon:yes stop_codon:yes gene_type:complete